MTRTAIRQIQERHLEAMGLCDRAVVARSKRDYAGAAKFFRRAFELERTAAEFLAKEIALEPTRSVLLRSAATLALECGEQREAEKLIARALSGDPPLEIAEELRDLLEQVNFQRHLDLRGLELAPDEVQLSITGKATGYGMAPSDEFVNRVQIYEKLIVRTFERKEGRPFRETGKAIKAIRENCELYLSTPRPGSFATTLKVGRPQKQRNLPNMEHDLLREPEKIIDDLFECLDTYNQNDQTRLAELIPDETYRRNFEALAAKLEPDGEQVKIVGLTMSREGKEKRIALEKRPHVSKAPASTSNGHMEETQPVIGVLRFANSINAGANRIKVVGDDGVEHAFVVRAGMMADIVKPLWEERVAASGVRERKVVYLQHITKVVD